VGNAKEKDIVLDLALRLGNSIKATYPDIKVIYTRTKDVFIPLYDRANIANKNKADLFISIHVNGTDKTSVQGTETFVLGQHRSKDNLEVAKKENSVILLEDDYNTKYEGFDPNSPESYIMFELVQDEYLEAKCNVCIRNSISVQSKCQTNRSQR
jgi:N-acetylmuramoyl-L-alanine amidase